jgi:hypothetical protein
MPYMAYGDNYYLCLSPNENRKNIIMTIDKTIGIYLQYSWY